LQVGVLRENIDIVPHIYHFRFCGAFVRAARSASTHTDTNAFACSFADANGFSDAACSHAGRGKKGRHGTSNDLNCEHWGPDESGRFGNVVAPGFIADVRLLENV